MSAHPNSSDLQKKEWEKRKRTRRIGGGNLPAGAVAFWGWGKQGATPPALRTHRKRDPLTVRILRETRL